VCKAEAGPVDVENADGEAAGDDRPAGDPGNDAEHRDGNGESESDLGGGIGGQGDADDRGQDGK
jgi:hypothetical protein